MKVAFFQPVLAHYRIELWNECSRAIGGRLTLFTVAPDRASGLAGFEEALECGLVRSRTYRLGPLWFVPRTLVEVVRGDWDVVVLSWNSRQVEILPVLLLARLRRTPLVIWGHGLGGRRSGMSVALRRLQARLATVVLTYSEAGASMVEDVAPSVRVGFVRNTTGRPAPGDEDVLDGICHRVACVGRLTERKRIDRLLQAIAILKDRGLVLGVDLIGDGPARATIEAEAEGLGIAEQVRMHGSVVDWELTRRALKAADLVVIPDAAGLSVVDAMAAGRAVLVVDDPVTNGPEAAEVIPGVTGERYWPATPDGLASALADLYDKPEHLIELSAGAVRFYNEELTLTAAGQSFRDAMSRAINSGG